MNAEAAIIQAETAVLEADASGDEDLAEAASERLEAVKQAAAELSIVNFVSIDRLTQVHLMKMIEKVEAGSESMLLRKAASGERGWQGAMAVLERRFKDDWGKKSTVDHNVHGDEDRPVVFAFESNDDRQRRVADVLARQNALEGSDLPPNSEGGGLPLIEGGEGNQGSPA